MKSQTTRSPLLVSAVLVVAMASYCARAQTTPGAIPGPGTYQGSTQLQQEQDRQAQQYRQQSAQPFQPQSQGSYPGTSSATSNSPGQPDCLDRLARQPELAPLAQKVYLGHTDVESTALFGIQSVPTASERPLLLKWSAGRRNCLLEAQQIQNPRGWSAAAIRADNLAGQMVIDMIVQLADGKLTYGQFNHQRTKNALAAAQIQ